MTCDTCGNDFHGRKPVENKEGERGVYCPYCKQFNKFKPREDKKQRKH